jgi:NADH:ubiquinone oxidoreductase subunit F (NADH-binding)
MTRLLGVPDVATPLPRVGPELIDWIEKAGLLGRGGAAFPVAKKWRAVAQHSRGDAVVVVNGAEGEPQSKKDRLLMTSRPHLILDGAFLASRVLRARRIVLYLGERHDAARHAMVYALGGRTEPERKMVAVAAAPARYVAGAETAAIHLIDEGVATPTNVPPYPFERGVGEAPTLVQNVETLTQIANVARGAYEGTTLLTIAGAVARPGVVEVPLGANLGDVLSASGGVRERSRAVLVGGYFGTWVEPEAAWRMPLGHSTQLGCGVIGIHPAGRCPVCDVAAIMRYLAAESSAQCGPCFFGLRALADACTRISEGRDHPGDLQRLQRWTDEVRGRGACRHPDGAVMFLSSALQVFGAEFANHRSQHSLGRTA